MFQSEGKRRGPHWAWTGPFAAAFFFGTIGTCVGYYATAYLNEVRWVWQAERTMRRLRRALVANFRSLRSIAVQFGPAEIIDSVVLRPTFLYAGPMLLGNVVVGWIIGSVLADVFFCAMTIVSDERFTTLLVRPERKTVAV